MVSFSLGYNSFEFVSTTFPINTTQLIIYTILAFLTKSIYEVLYDAYLSPLNKLPGPKLNAFSSYHITRHRSKGKTFEYLHKLYHQFGNVVRVGPKTVLITDGDAIRQILITKELPKTDNIKEIRSEPNAYTLVTAVDTGRHKKRRRQLSPAFSIKYLSSIEPFAHECIKVLINKLQTVVLPSSLEPTVINIYQLVQYCSLDIIGEIAFGESFRLVETGSHPLPEKIINELRRRVLRSTFTFLKPVLKMDPWIKNFTDKLISERREMNANGKQRNDIMQILVDTRDDDTGRILSDSDIFDQTMEFLIAGSDTTGFTVNMALINLLNNPEKLATLVAELDNLVFESSEKTCKIPTHDVLKNLPYLNAVLSETERLFPVSAAGFFRKVPEDTVINGTFLPAGTTAIAFVPGIQRAKKIWGPDANDFVPERWLDERVPRSHFYPFGGGSRICIGLNLATMTMRVMLASLLLNFDFTRIGGQNLDLVQFITPSLKTKQYHVGIRSRC